MTEVDKQDEILFIKEVFSHIVQSDPTYYNELMKLVSDEEKVKLETCIKNAESRTV
jgi:hypothetical protein